MVNNLLRAAGFETCPVKLRMEKLKAKKAKSVKKAEEAKKEEKSKKKEGNLTLIVRAKDELKK